MANAKTALDETTAQNPRKVASLDLASARADASRAVQSRYVVLKTTETEFIVDAKTGARPKVLYWGPALENTEPEELDLLSVRQWAHGGAAIDVPPSLSNELGAGVPGPPGFVAHRNSTDWAAIFKVSAIEQNTPYAATITCDDVNTQLRVQYLLGD